MTLVFRSLEPVAKMRWEAFASSDHEPSIRQLRAVLAARLARVAGGAAGVVAGVAVFVLAIVRLTLPERLVERAPRLGEFLGVGAFGALAVWFLARAALPLALRRAFSRVPSIGRGSPAEVAAFEAQHPVRVAARTLARIEPWSVALPLVASALLAPLTSHMLLAFVLSGSFEPGFDDWISVSVVVVGHAHLALAVHGVVWARRVARTPRDLLPTLPGWLWGWGAAVIAAAIPGSILYLVPPLLTAATGLVSVPPAYLLLRRSVVAERGAMAGAWMATFG
jgi:hypothetical protein